MAHAALRPLLLLAPAAFSGICPAAERLSPLAERGSPALFAFACDNDLTAVVDARPGSRTVFAEIGVRVGSRDEPESLAGMSHLLEHLLFEEGSAAFTALRGYGANVNASTDFELT